jgi:hypothetical protein
MELARIALIKLIANTIPSSPEAKFLDVIGTKSYEFFSLLFTDHLHRVHTIATGAFWRTFSDEGKISPGW